MPEIDERRKSILDAAAALFARKGVASTTIREIADAAGLVSGSLYHYYPSKDLIVQEIIRGNLTDLMDGYRSVQKAAGEPRIQLRALIKVSLDTAQAHPHASEVYQSEQAALVEREGFEYLRSATQDIQNVWLDVITAGVERSDFRSDIPAPIFYRLIRDAVWLSVRWIQTNGGYATDELADQCASIFLDGILTPVD